MDGKGSNEVPLIHLGIEDFGLQLLWGAPNTENDPRRCWAPKKEKPPRKAAREQRWKSPDAIIFKNYQGLPVMRKLFPEEAEQVSNQCECECEEEEELYYQ
jgi:hypothetical protein